EPDDGPMPRITHRRGTERDVLLIHARRIAADQIPPSIRPAPDRMRIVLAARLDLQKYIRRPIRTVIIVRIAISDQPLIARAEQIASMKHHPLSAARRPI